MDPAQGFSAQTGGAAVLLTAAHLGFPLSTTHSITGAVLGAGAAKRLSAVRWGLAGNIFLAWVLTLPCAAAVGALTYGVSRIFGDGALGPLLVSVALVALLFVAVRQAAAARTGPDDGGGLVIAAIDTDALLELAWAAPLAVLTVTVAWGLVIRGTTLALEAGARGAPAPAALHALVAVAGAALFLAARRLRPADHDLEGLTAPPSPLHERLQGDVITRELVRMRTSPAIVGARRCALYDSCCSRPSAGCSPRRPPKRTACTRSGRARRCGGSPRRTT